jgi:transcriptional regulator with XRE-family HTH domain/tetratricopeptide (TPR) repeat protein
VATRHPLSFGDLLRRYRIAAGLSQEELAERAELSRRGVSDLERGLVHRPYRDTVTRLANALTLSEPERALFVAAARSQQTSSAHGSVGAYRPGAGIAHAGSAHDLTPLVDRQRELSLIEQHLCAHGPNAPPLLVLTGEPGIGKSRLLHEATAQARQAGWTVLSGGCVRRSGREPYEPFVDVLARAVARTPSAAQQRRDVADCGWLARLLPELVATAPVPMPTWTLHPDQERRLMFAAVRRYLANVAGLAGALLVLDDLQWAGSDALDLLAELVRKPGEASLPALRVIAAYRSTEVRPSDPLASLLADLEAASDLTRVQLGPLAAEEAAVLLDHLLAYNAHEAAGATGREEPELLFSPAVHNTVLQRAEGIPYYLVSAAHALLSGELDKDDGRRLWQVPWTVAQSIRTRSAALSERGRELLGVAAVIGRVGPSSLLMTLAARTDDQSDEDEEVGALEELGAAGLLIEQGSDYQFGHDLIREVVLADLSGARSRVLHRRVAKALARLPDSLRERHLAEIADHYVEAGDGAASLPYAIEAGDHAASAYAHAEAERLYTLAVTLAEVHGDRRREAEAREGLSAALIRRARYSEALATIETALSAYQALGDVEGQARVAEGALHAHRALATFEVGIARLEPLVEDLRRRGLSQIGQARLYNALGGLLMQSGAHDTGTAAISRLSEALKAADRAIMLARAAEHDGVLARAMLTRAHTLTWLGRVEAGLDAFEGALPLAEGAGDLRTLFAGLTATQAVREVRGEFDLSQRHIDRGLALGECVGDPIQVAHMWHNQAELAYYRGDWTLARTAIERSLKVVQAYELAESFPETQRYLSQLYCVVGEQEQADALVAVPLAIAVERHDLQELRMAYSLIAERDLLAGRAEAVRTYLEPLLDRPGLEECQVLVVLPQLAWALLALGNVTEAEARAMQSCERARAYHYHLWLVDGLWVMAMVRLRQERWEEACALLEEAIALCRAMSYPYAEAKALYIYGHLHAARGESELARQHYQAALTICERLGEGLYRPHVERALADLKRRDGSPGDQGVSQGQGS